MYSLFDNLKDSIDMVISVPQDKIEGAEKLLEENGYEPSTSTVAEAYTVSRLNATGNTKQRIMERIPEDKRTESGLQFAISTVVQEIESKALEVDFEKEIDSSIKELTK